MTTDIYWLDAADLDHGAEGFDELFNDYLQTLVEDFRASEEAAALADRVGDPGVWAGSFIEMSARHIGGSLASFSRGDVEEVVTELFPKKITLGDAAHAQHIVPELIGFWTHLARIYELENAAAIITWLEAIEPDFPAIMNDSKNFGIAKSFATLGAEAGYDMSDPDQLSAFMQHYNATLAGNGGLGMQSLPEPDLPARTSAATAAAKRSKAKRKMAKKSRRGNRAKKH